MNHSRPWWHQADEVATLLKNTLYATEQPEP